MHRALARLRPTFADGRKRERHAPQNPAVDQLAHVVPQMRFGQLDGEPQARRILGHTQVASRHPREDVLLRVLGQQKP